MQVQAPSTPHAHPRRAAPLAALVAVLSLVVGSLAMPAEAAAAESGCLRISSAVFDPAGSDTSNLTGEKVVIKNVCSSTANLYRYKVTDRYTQNTYVFGSKRVAPGSTVTLHVGKGSTTTRHVYWGRTRPVFDNFSYERAYLRKPTNTIVSQWPRSTSSGGGGTSTTTSPWSVAFGSRPRSNPISLFDCRDVTISNKTFKDTPSGTPAIRLTRCHNVTIRAVDLINVAGGIQAYQSSNIRVIDVRYENIYGPSTRSGANVGNFVQFDQVNGGLIDHNKGRGGDTEDVVSLHKSSNIIVEDNHFEGTNWVSTSSSGIALGDAGGSGNVARRNKLLNIGQVGIFISGGSNHRMENNVIYGEPRVGSNVGVYLWNQTSGSCSGHVISGNRVRWYKASGTRSGFWNGGGCSASMSGNTWYDSSITESGLRVSGL